MAINGIELEVGQEWLTRGGQRVRVKAHLNGHPKSEWPFVVEMTRDINYTVTPDGYALDITTPRETDLVQPLRRDSDHAAPLPTAEPQDANTVTSAQVNDWIDWHGGECPVGPSTPVEVRLRMGREFDTKQPGDFHWGHDDELSPSCEIVAYRVVKPTLSHERAAVDGERESNRVFPDISEELRAAGDVRLRGLVSWSQMMREAIDGTFGKLGKPDDSGMCAAPGGIGDINSDAKGSGARYNNGKASLELIPLSVIVPFFHNDESLTDGQRRALQALDALGMFQAREGNVYEVLRELGDHWEDCARVFDYGRRKYAEWNWARGMKWSVPIGCAARHLMAIIRGEETDPESGLPHVGHVYCNVVMLLTYASTFSEGDDRPAKGMLL